MQNIYDFGFDMRFSENLTAQLAFVINGSQTSFLFEVFHAYRLAFHQFLVYFKPYTHTLRNQGIS